MKLNRQQLINLVLGSFEAERNNDVARGLEILHPDFRKISILVGSDGNPFPTINSTQTEAAFRVASSVKGRKFDIVSVSADETNQIVHVEVIETEPQPTGQDLIWTYVAVCVIKDGKIWRTRHYGDPDLTAENFTESEILKVINA
jgi:ketosteroid isomerase-like protein